MILSLLPWVLNRISVQYVRNSTWRKFLFNTIAMSLMGMLAFFYSACSSSLLQPTVSAHGLLTRKTITSRWTYVAIGASDTYGIGSDNPHTQNWAAQLADRLGPNVHLVNLGIPGVDAPDAVNIELPVALDAHPNLITIWLAVNDLVDNVPLPSYQKNLNLLLGSLRNAFPSSQILVANIPDLTYLPRFSREDQRGLRTKISSYNTVIASCVASQHATLVNLYTRWQTLANHPEYISDDGYHPSAVGYQQIAKIFYQTMRL